MKRCCPKPHVSSGSSLPSRAWASVRAYAKFRGRHAKSDPIDACLIVLRVQLRDDARRSHRVAICCPEPRRPLRISGGSSP